MLASEIADGKFRDHSECCMQALEIFLTNDQNLFDFFMMRWDELSDLDEKLPLFSPELPNCMTTVVQSEPLEYLALGHLSRG